MFGWFRKRVERLQPEAHWTVSVEPDRIQVTDNAGNTAALAKADLAGVLIETNDTGPWGADVWWFMFGADERLSCSFPQGATGESAALDYLMKLPDFDYGQMALAMGSTANASFPVWTKVR